MTTHQPDDITLCKSCWCATKTVDGMCGKCGAVKGQPDDELDELDDILYPLKLVSQEHYDTGMKMLKSLVASKESAARKNELEALKMDFYGIISEGGDHKNGNKHFMLGVSAVLRGIEDRLKALTQSKEEES